MENNYLELLKILMDNNYLDLLIDLIINNSRLDYNGENLRIDEEKPVIEVIKIIAKEKYENKVKELKEEKSNKEMGK